MRVRAVSRTELPVEVVGRVGDGEGGEMVGRVRDDDSSTGARDFGLRMIRATTDIACAQLVFAGHYAAPPSPGMSVVAGSVEI